MAKLPQASGSSGFGDRLAAAMETARSGQAQAAEQVQAAQLASPATESDDFSGRLRDAMAQARGEEVSEAEAAPSTAAEPSAAAEPVPEDTGPAGTGERLVRAGDSIASIAFDTGHYGPTIWDDSGNTELRAARTSPEILLTGDRVHVPELRRKEEPGQTEMRHRFRRKGMPEKLRLQLQAFDEPRDETPYVLEVAGQFLSGETDEDGWLEEWLPPNARRGLLRIGEDEEYHLQIGGLAPITEMAGVVDRLVNLGFLDDGDMRDEEAIRAAVTEFQSRYGLRVTGQADQPTRDRLVQEHGS